MYQQVSHPFLNLPFSVHNLHFQKSEKFETKDSRWAPDGKGFILLGKDQFCCAFEVLEEAGET